MLKQLEHDNVVKLLNVFCDTPQQGSNLTYKLYLVFEFCDMDLKKLMEQNGGLDYELTKVSVYLSQEMYVIEQVNRVVLLRVKEKNRKTSLRIVEKEIEKFSINFIQVL